MEKKPAGTLPEKPTKESCSHECSSCATAGTCSDAKAGLPPKADIDVKHVILVLSGKGLSLIHI